MATGKRVAKKQHPFIKHIERLGFTNRLAVYILLLLVITLAGGFFLAVKSIQTGYTGALMCYTVVVTPVDTAIGIVLNKIVHKSEVENSGADGEGIKYAAAKANGFVQSSGSNESPAI